MFTRTLLYAREAITNGNCNAWIDDRSSKFLTRKAPRILLLRLCVVMQILHNYKLENFPKERIFLFSQRLTRTLHGMCYHCLSSWSGAPGKLGLQLIVPPAFTPLATCRGLQFLYNGVNKPWFTIHQVQQCRNTLPTKKICIAIKNKTETYRENG